MLVLWYYASIYKSTITPFYDTRKEMRKGISKEKRETYCIPRCKVLLFDTNLVLCASKDPDDPYPEMEEADENI